MSNNIRRSSVELAASALNRLGLARPADCIDTFRLFLDNLDFSSEDSDGWCFLEILLSTQAAGARGIDADAHYNIRTALAMWSLRMLAPDMKNNFVEISAANSLLVAWIAESMDVFDFLLKIFDNFIDARVRPGGYSTLMNILFYYHALPRGDPRLKMILTRGADSHLIGFEEKFSPQKETPTSLAMYSARAFSNWREALLQISTDLELFVQKELQQSPLKSAGWHENSLLSLFQSHIHPRYNRRYFSRCDMCRKSISPLVELRWRRWLDSIKEV